MRYTQFITLALGMLFSIVPAQEVDTLDTTTDHREYTTFSWTGRLCRFSQDRLKTFQLFLPWDTWGHSDLFATAANPFVTSDLRLGALRLDGSLGVPINSAAIPSIVVSRPNLNKPANTYIAYDLQTPSHHVDQEYHIAPLQDFSRENQTYFFWDQGSYEMQDVQIGGSTQLDETRNLVIAGQARRHPGFNSRFGPDRNNSDGNVLQNYILDYEHQNARSFRLNYTLLHQKEHTGLPLMDQGRITSDRRQSRTLAHGLQLDWTPDPVNIQLHAATSTNYLTIKTDTIITGTIGEEYIDRLDRNSFSLWAGGTFIYKTGPFLNLIGSLDIKQRNIADNPLGYKMSNWLKSQIGVNLTKGKISAYGGLVSVDNQLKLDGWISYGGLNSSLSLIKESTAFFDYPHHNRREFQDTVSWLANPLLLERIMLTGSKASRSGIITAQLVYLETRDHRAALSAGFMMDWELWADVLGISGSGIMVGTQDTRIFPTRLFTQTGLTFTIPLQRMRARPFAAATVSYISNDFSTWLDPRYADSASYLNPDGTKASTFWVSAEAGLKANNFELRFRIYNPFQATIQNSPYYLPQQGSGNLLMRHYSLSWRFPPQASVQSGPATD